MRCLIVEDDATSRKLLQAFLAEHAECSLAANGREAVEAFEVALYNGPFDLICLDIMMPDMGGREALAEIRNIEAEHGIGGLDGVKVVMTTALDDPANIFGSFREGCEAYVVKPVCKEKLLAQIIRLGILAPTP